MRCTCCGLGRYQGLNQCAPARQRNGITEHPATITLEEGHALGRDGLAQMFRPGSRWHYGPVYENMETHVRVIEPPKQARGLRDNNLAVWRTLKNGRRECIQEGPRTWFVKCEVITSRFKASGEVIDLPPCALVPRAAVVWERNTFGLREGEAPTPVELDTIKARSQTDTIQYPAWWKVNRDRFCEPHQIEHVDCRRDFLPAYGDADIEFCCAAMHALTGVSEVEVLRAENATLRSKLGVEKARATKALKGKREAEDKLAAVRRAVR